MKTFTTTAVALSPSHTANQPVVFRHETFGNLRVVADERTSKPRFVAKDVCDSLGLGTEQIRRLDGDERNTLRLTQGIARRGNPNISIISEPGLYTLVLRSRKPEAKPSNAG